MIRHCGRAGVLLALVVLSCAGLAEAHTHLKTSSPAAGATLANAPTEIRLQFHEAIEASVSHVSVETKAGQAVAAGAPAPDPGDKTALVLRLAEPLKPGAYKVSWRVISADTHKVKGSFTFQVRP